jgi:hypothetical protein
VYLKELNMNKLIIHDSEYLSRIPKNHAAQPEGLPPAAAAGRIKISSFDDLCKIGMADNYPLNGCYELTANIDATPSRESCFLPIGTPDNPFTGSFDGKNYSISGLYIDLPMHNQVGLFGHTTNAEINEVCINADSITGGLDVGALVGFAEHTVINGCRSSGRVSGQASIGGLAGSTSTTLINKCYSSCNCYSAGYQSGIWHSSSVGGLVGHAQGDTAITDSCAASYVEGAYSNVGGLLGFAGSVNIDKCCSASSVRGDIDVGGFVGNIANTMGQNIISNCYSAGCVNGNENLSVGGFVGNVDRGAVIRNCYSTGKVETGSGFSPPICYDAMSNCFWDIETSNRPQEIKNSNVTAKSSAEMKRRATFANWDFEAIWDIDEGNSYPKLRSIEPPLV